MNGQRWIVGRAAAVALWALGPVAPAAAVVLASAADEAVRYELSAPSSEIDPVYAVTFTARFTAPAEYALDIPEPMALVAGFERLGPVRVREFALAGRWVREYVFRAQPLLGAEFRAAPFTLVWQDRSAWPARPGRMGVAGRRLAAVGTAGAFCDTFPAGERRAGGRVSPAVLLVVAAAVGCAVWARARVTGEWPRWLERWILLGRIQRLRATIDRMDDRSAGELLARLLSGVHAFATRRREAADGPAGTGAAAARWRDELGAAGVSSFGCEMYAHLLAVSERWRFARGDPGPRTERIADELRLLARLCLGERRRRERRS